MSSKNLPRPEHPNPQFRRDRWENLNGAWSFELDFAGSGIERNFPTARSLSSTILVPFCVESELSGIGYRDFIPACWYQRNITIPPEWEGLRVLLHFGAVDFESWVYLDGVLLGTHYGGSAPFAVDISPHIGVGRQHNVVVLVRDNIRCGHQPGGKQSLEYYSAGCFYTRVTGIWQTVWLEAVNPVSLVDAKFLCDAGQGILTVLPRYRALRKDLRLRVSVVEDGAVLASAQTAVAQGQPVSLRVPGMQRWAPSHPHLYDIQLEMLDPSGVVLDSVWSYTGFREILVEGNRLLLNGEPLYLRFVLDQGYYPDGLWTAPSDEALRRDIEYGLACGFNGARLHQKAFEPRYHYWADKLGYLTWAESASWGMKLTHEESARNFLSEWASLVERDRNHPSVIAWTPLNETWDISIPAVHHRLHRDAYELTHQLDGTRPVNDASGGCHVKTDLYTVHIYEEDPDLLYEKLKISPKGEVFRTLDDKEAAYEGQPYIVAEFGGIRWLLDSRLPFSIRSWGYGNSPVSSEEFYKRLSRQVQAILRLSHCTGFCYTQLVDVEQEENGLFTYDRVPKFDPELIRRIFTAEALPASADLGHGITSASDASSAQK